MQLCWACVRLNWSGQLLPTVHFGALLEHSWAHVRPMLGRLIGTNGFNRGPVGAILGDMGVAWGCVWPCRRPCLACVGPFGRHDGPILGLLGSHITQRVLDRNVWLVQSYLLQYSTLLRVLYLFFPFVPTYALCHLDMLKCKAVPKEKKASCWPNSSPGKGLSTLG